MDESAFLRFSRDDRRARVASGEQDAAQGVEPQAGELLLLAVATLAMLDQQGRTADSKWRTCSAVGSASRAGSPAPKNESQSMPVPPIDSLRETSDHHRRMGVV